jgi:GAF domain-containing protein
LEKELEARTRELSEAREQQAATTEVLQVISSSPGELERVFEAMLAKAVRICEAKFGNLLLYDGNAFRFAALHNAPPAWDELRRHNPVVRPGPNNPLCRMAATKRLQHIADIRKEQAYIEREPLIVSLAELAGARTLVGVPMVRENELIGAIGIYRQEVRPFTDKQIELVQNFAAQAVIAIENTRLLNELRQRTDDLSESLEQQTATSEVLQVISSSPGDLQPVFQAMLESATRICQANFGNLYLRDGDVYRLAAAHNTPPSLIDERKNVPLRVTSSSGRLALDKMAQTKQVVHVVDVMAHQGYADRHPQTVRAVELAGIRTVAWVPMLKDNELIGCGSAVH